MREHVVRGAGGVPFIVNVHGEPKGSPTVLLVHGWARSAEYWDDVVTALAPDYAVVVPSLRMHGASLELRDENVPVSIPLLVEDVRLTLLSLGVASCVAVGHSMGGQVVTLLADESPELVSTTIAFDPAYGALPDEIAKADTRRRDHVAVAIAKYRMEHPASSSERTQRYARALEELYDSEYLLEHSIGAIDHTAPVLNRRRRPSLVVYATSIGVETEARLTRHADIPPEILQWTQGGGHDFPAAHPESVGRLISEWVARMPA